LQNVLGVVHSFTGDFNLASKFLDLGLYLGLNGIITFTDEYDDMVAKIPLDRILIETDAPYLAPVPHRGERNEPLYVEFVARRIAEIKKISFEEVVEKTKENAIRLFKLNEKV
jgi:TatD DNase family protein